MEYATLTISLQGTRRTQERESVCVCSVYVTLQRLQSIDALIYDIHIVQLTHDHHGFISRLSDG